MEGDRVRERRQRLSMTQEQLAAEAGVNRDTVGRIESGTGFTQRKLTQIQATLDRLEDETGIDAPPLAPASDGQIEFEVYEHSAAEIAEIYEIRAASEGYAARLACARATDAEIDEIAAANTAVDLASPQDRVAANDTFHDLITRACGNRPSSN